MGINFDKERKSFDTGILWSWAGDRWQDGYFYSEEGEERKPFVSSIFSIFDWDRRRGTQPYRVSCLHLPRPEGETL